MATRTQQAAPENPSMCRFLGLQDDPQTSFAFPSDWNNCHHCKPVVAVSLAHQGEYCLTSKHTDCPVFIQEEPGSLPRELQNRQQVRSGARRLVWVVVLVIVLGTLLALGVGFAPQVETFLTPIAMAISHVTATEQVINSPVPSPVEETPSPIPTLSPTSVLPSASATLLSIETSLSSPFPSSDSAAVEATPTITRIPNDLESLIGINHIFKIHRIRQGENLNLLAYEYGTTIAAISAVNYHFTTPLWVQQVIIIPVNQKDVSDLPPFEPYRVLVDTDLESLASQLDVDPEQLRSYNGLGNSNQVSAGEWLVVPRGD